MPQVVEVPDEVQNCRTDVLVLLVGGNPLPNAVAGTLLSGNNSTIVLVHSLPTYHVARQLANFFGQDGSRRCLQVEVQEADPGDIYRQLYEALQSGDLQRRATVGLHYTGGTKAMAVHAYAAVADWAKHQGISPVLSYLDARTLSLRFASGHGGRTIEAPIGAAVRMSLEEMFGLHGWVVSRSELPNDTPRWPRTAQELAKLRAIDAAWKKYRLWLRSLNDEISTAQGGGICMPFPSDGALSGFVSIWKDELELDQSARELELSPELHRKAKRWLEGRWLEHHVLRILQDLAADLDLHDCLQHVVPRDRATGMHFDLDVTAIRGYQLFAFSCGLSTKRDKLKLKLLEVATRARQVGGDEARAALVCGWDDPQGLEREARQQLGNDAVRVFGSPHLLNLKGEIKGWMRGLVYA